jgi:hypothetical protein
LNLAYHILSTVTGENVLGIKINPNLRKIGSGKTDIVNVCGERVSSVRHLKREAQNQGLQQENKQI